MHSRGPKVKSTQAVLDRFPDITYPSGSIGSIGASASLYPDQKKMCFQSSKRCSVSDRNFAGIYEPD